MEDWASRRRVIEQSSYGVSPKGRHAVGPRRPFKIIVAALGKVLRFTPLYARGRRNALDVQRVEFEVALPGLPAAFDGYRILHVSDTHLDYLPELAGVARALLADVDVDMLALTGDILGDHGNPIERSVELLTEAVGAVNVRGPRLAVLGNHDPSTMAALLERAGFDVLINRSIALEREAALLRVAGLDDVNTFYTEAARSALHDHTGEFRIALVHSAEVADYADDAGYALYLCGHTHGGQIALPGGRPLVTHLRRCRRAASGLWRQGRMAGYTNRGLGVSDLPLRFNTRGEVVIITLRRDSNVAA